jgi:TPR repeat protein
LFYFIAHYYREAIIDGSGLAVRSSMYDLAILFQDNVIPSTFTIPVLLDELSNESRRGIYSDILLKLQDFGGAKLGYGYTLLVGAAELGEPRAQHVLAGAYQTGILPGSPATIVPLDAGRALLLEYMSALAGLPEANMGMAWRYSYGIGVTRSCEKATLHYEYVADHVVSLLRSRPFIPYIDKTHLNAKADISSRRSAFDFEVVDYYTHLAQRDGDSNAAFSLASLFLQGNADIEQDIQGALKYLRLAADDGHVAASGQLAYLMLQGLKLNDTTGVSTISYR